MADKKYIFFNGDKHAHLKFMLFDGLLYDLKNEDYDGAFLMVQCFLWLYPEDIEGKEKLKGAFIDVGDRLFKEKNKDKIHDYITAFIKDSPVIRNSIEKDIISSLEINLEDHYLELSYALFMNGQYNKAMPLCAFVLLLNIENKHARILNYMIHKAIFQDNQIKTGNYSLNESYYLTVENNLLLVNLIYDVSKKGTFLFVNKIVGQGKISRGKYAIRNIKTKDDKILICYCHHIQHNEISMLLTNIDNEYLFNIYYVKGSKNPKITLENFLGNDLTEMIKKIKINPEEYELLNVA